ncbi:MAG TPA: hypothetical protein VNS55_12680 [Nocardioides sp.]|nr:hypothetical protein [Nocardioides sp.]
MSHRAPTPPRSAGSSARRTGLTALLASLALTGATVSTAAFSLASGGTEALPPAAADVTSSSTESSAATYDAPATYGQDPRAHLPISPVSPVSDVQADLAAIPLPAMAAYQRAAQVIDRADRSCRLDWTVLAAVGQVVSRHGLSDGGRLTHGGVVKPAMVGKVVRNDAGARLLDTDAGRLDGDKRHDRAVGPMLLAPTTWTVVGVDADDNGRRDPQDVDDAALAVSVLLCSGDLDLAKDKQLTRAISRINDDKAFVQAVLTVAASYAQQESATPVMTVPGPVTVPSDLPTHVVPARTTAPSATPSDPVNPGAGHTEETGAPADPETSDTATPEPSDTDSPSPSADPTDVCPTEEPTDATSPSDLPSDEPTDGCTDTASGEVTDPPVPSDTPTP